MTLNSSRLASGPGWRVDDIVCTAGPRDHPFEEKHDGMCIAAVTAGTFQYRSAQGSAVLAPGALLLGNDRQCFECGHEHGIGDRCLSFHFTPELMEAIAAEVPGVRRAAFAVARLPPLAALAPILAAVEAARDDGEGAEFEELALRLAGAVSAALVGTRPTELRAPSRRDERRVTAALRRIEEDAPEQLSLADLAREAAASPYHFLRIFRQVVGMTPHQFLLRARLHRAAVRLRRSGDTVLTIALESGFNDLSTFNRRFRRVMGRSPSAYRGRGETAAPR
jgi:AraC-like DNA-binding protein